jgi:hypothetical protein
MQKLIFNQIISNDEDSGAVGPMFFFWGGEPRAVRFRQTEKIFRQTKNFSGRQHFKSSPPPPSTTLTISDNIDNFPTISDNIDNFPTGLNNRGAMAPPATASLDEDPSLRIESFTITNLCGVYTKLNL